MKQVPIEIKQSTRGEDLEQALRQSGQRLKSEFDDALFQRCQESIRKEMPRWLGAPQTTSQYPFVAERILRLRKLFASLAAVAVALVFGLFLFQSDKPVDGLSSAVVVNSPETAETAGTDKMDKTAGLETAPELVPQAVADALYPLTTWFEQSPTAHMYQAVESRLLEAEKDQFQSGEFLLSAAKLTTQISDFDVWQQKTGDYIARLSNRIPHANTELEPESE